MKVSDRGGFGDTDINDARKARIASKPRPSVLNPDQLGLF